MQPFDAFTLLEEVGSDTEAENFELVKSGEEGGEFVE
jgi:hypothetical protein